MAAQRDFKIGFGPAVYPQRFDMRRHERRARRIVDAIAASWESDHTRPLFGVFFIQVGERVERREVSIGIDADHLSLQG